MTVRRKGRDETATERGENNHDASVWVNLNLAPERRRDKERGEPVLLAYSSRLATFHPKVSSFSFSFSTRSSSLLHLQFGGSVLQTWPSKAPTRDQS